MYINKVLIYGNLTRDPELKSLPSGIQVCTIGIATNRVYTDKDGKKQEQTDYHSVVVFGRSAQTAGQFLRKGSGVFVEGRLQTRSWDDKESGKKQYRTEIVADRVQFGPRSGGTGGGSEGGSAPRSSGPSTSAPAPASDINYPVEEINPDDIPF